MRTRASIAVLGLLLATTAGHAQGPADGADKPVLTEKRAPLLPAASNSKEPWLGVSVSKPSDAVYAQLRDIPTGVGFVVHRLAPEGPSGEAGMHLNDFLWKLDDQILVNEAQFLTLLNMRKVGQTVKLTVQRAGENRELEVKLTVRPEGERGQQEAELAIIAVPPIPGMPRQLVDVLRRVASVRDASGTVRVERQPGGFRWEWFDPDGMKIDEDRLRSGEASEFPEKMSAPLKAKLRVLIRTLEDAERRSESGTRVPRVRRVPAPVPDKVGNP